MSKKRKNIEWIVNKLSELRDNANKFPSEDMAVALEAVERNIYPEEKNSRYSADANNAKFPKDE